VALLPLPGPGWLVVFLGLGVLATEFAWADRALRTVRRQVERSTAWLATQGAAVRAAAGVGTLVVVLAVLVGLTWVVGTPSWVPDAMPLVR
jgi:uncharacterized protein (TIGR02611 family)